MALCPYCGSEVIEGDDTCSECQASLADLHLPLPATNVERALLSDHVGELNPKVPLAVAPDTPVGEVLAQMVDNRIGCLLVIDDGELKGIFTERDALMKLGAEVEDRRERPVSDFMTPSVETLTSTAKVAFAVQRMDVGDFRHLPIVGDDGATQGVISVRDILRYLTDRIREGG